MPKVPRAGFASMMKEGSKVGGSALACRPQSAWPRYMWYSPVVCSTSAAWMKPFSETWKLVRRSLASQEPHMVPMVRECGIVGAYGGCI